MIVRMMLDSDNFEDDDGDAGILLILRLVFWNFDNFEDDVGF